MKSKSPKCLSAVILYFSLLCSIACKKEAGSASLQLSTRTVATPSLTISVDKSSVRADNFDQVVITVKEGEMDVTSSALIIIDGPSQPPMTTVNGITQPSNKFYTLVPGSYSIKANKDGHETQAITVTALDPGPSPFSQKVLVEDYTATWCPYSPRVGVALKDYSVSNPRCVLVGIHGFEGSSDPYTFRDFTALLNFYFYGNYFFPDAIVNRNFEWDEDTSSLESQLAKRASLGIALETTVNGNTVNVKAKVKFDVTTSFPLKIVIMLVEDGLVYPQRNYYAPVYGDDPISNYIHQNTLRAPTTDILGDDIPLASQIAGNTWEKNFLVDATGYIRSNCKIVATVIYDSDTYDSNMPDRQGSLNTQIVNAGQDKDFD